MASEIRVNKINSQTGVGTITLSPTGVDISGITTAATLKTTTGIVTTFEATTGNITTLRAPTGIVTSLEATTGDITTLRAPTGIVTSLEATTGDITTLRAPTGIVTSFVTNTAKVGAAVTISESGIEASGIGITCANINGSAIGGRRNLIINGAMNIAQRGTSSTSSGFYTVDRFRLLFSGHDEALTQAQHALSTSDTPYSLGFRYSFHVTNGNQTSGGGGTDYAQLLTTIEAQDIANSGWNYTSSTSFITLSFWVKSSVAQNFYGALRTQDGTVRSFPFETGSLTADTWKKVVIKVPGDSSSTYDNDNGQGLQVFFWAYRGPDYTGSVTLNQWNTWNTNTGTPDMDTTWWTTNDSTIEFTGFQLEVGAEATAFEHLMRGEELLLCQRYYQVCVEGDNQFVCFGDFFTAGQCDGGVTLPVEMRTTPSLDVNTGADYYIIYTDSTWSHIDGNFNIFKAHKRAVLWYAAPDTNRTAGHANRWITNNSSAKIAFDAEL